MFVRKKLKKSDSPEWELIFSSVVEGWSGTTRDQKYFSPFKPQPSVINCPCLGICPQIDQPETMAMFTQQLKVTSFWFLHSNVTCTFFLSDSVNGTSHTESDIFELESGHSQMWGWIRYISDYFEDNHNLSSQAPLNATFNVILQRHGSQIWTTDKNGGGN